MELSNVGNATFLSSIVQYLEDIGTMRLSSLVPQALFASSALAGYGQGHKSQQQACEKLAKTFKEPSVTVNFATYVPAGTNVTFQQDANLTTCTRPFQVVPVDLCRVAMAVSTSERSGITLEAWLPTNWTGR